MKIACSTCRAVDKPIAGLIRYPEAETHAPLCRAVDKPIAGLIQDLKQRHAGRKARCFTSEFGRSPWSQNTTGRDHNPKGYMSWFARGGIKGGTIHGATDAFGYKAVEDPHYYSDLHRRFCTTRSRLQKDADPRFWTAVSSC